MSNQRFVTDLAARIHTRDRKAGDRSDNDVLLGFRWDSIHVVCTHEDLDSPRFRTWLALLGCRLVDARVSIKLEIIT